MRQIKRGAMAKYSARVMNDVNAGELKMFLNNNNYNGKAGANLKMMIVKGDCVEFPMDGFEESPAKSRDSESESADSPMYNEHSAMEDCEFQSSKKIKMLKEERFPYRRKSNAARLSGGLDAFSILSDEIVLSILSHLPHSTLCVVGQVCQRLWRLSRDESLWPRLDLGGRYLPQDSIAHIINRGTRVLRLATARISTPVFCQTKPLLDGFTCKLELLDLSECNISPEDMELFLNKCKHLKKLSLESCELSYGVCHEIAQNINLDTLNLCMCSNISADGLKEIFDNCKSIKSLNIGWTHVNREAMDVIVRNIPRGIQHLNLSGSQNVLTDYDIKLLGMRCKELVELDVSDCLELTTAIVPSIVQNFRKLRTISFSRCFRINFQQMISEVSKMPRLEKVNAFRHISSDQSATLEAMMPRIRYNQEPFSKIARPTVGIRRTSIWETRCRE